MLACLAARREVLLVHCLMASAFFFFFYDTATPEIYTLSLHDALPILSAELINLISRVLDLAIVQLQQARAIGKGGDRKSTRLNSSHGYISYAVFCLKKKKRLEHTYLRTRHSCVVIRATLSTSRLPTPW